MDHLKYTLELGDGPGTTGFSDLTLIHNCLPGLAWDQVTLATSFAGLNLKHPIIFNAYRVETAYLHKPPNPRSLPPVHGGEGTLCRSACPAPIHGGRWPERPEGDATLWNTIPFFAVLNR